jgi:hypothetical protein
MGIADMFNNAVMSVTGKTPQEHADSVKSALSLPPAVSTDSGSAKMLGATPEAPGTTITGGRRRKTRGAKRGSKKTRRGGKRRH